MSDISVFWPAFGCCANPKVGGNPIFGRFQKFCSFFHFFFIISPQGVDQPLLKILFSSVFLFLLKSRKKMQHNKKKWLKKVKILFEPVHHQKDGQNTQHLTHSKLKQKMYKSVQLIIKLPSFKISKKSRSLRCDFFTNFKVEVCSVRSWQPCLKVSTTNFSKWTSKNIFYSKMVVLKLKSWLKMW